MIIFLDQDLVGPLPYSSNRNEFKHFTVYLGGLKKALYVLILSTANVIIACLITLMSIII